jgi:predicted  nucleic acid-binding Zn-ribbon protein
MTMLQNRMEELLSERVRLTEGIARRESMVENKTRQQGEWSKSGKVYKEYQSEIFRWNSERMEMEGKLSELDTETDGYEQTIKAVRGEQGLGAFSLSVRDHIEEIRQGRRLSSMIDLI